jgi:methyltransferase family protein
MQAGDSKKQSFYRNTQGGDVRFAICDLLFWLCQIFWAAMFFANRIRSILPNDRVLEIGPGATPHPRSGIFLEKRFPEPEAIRHRGGLAAVQLNRPVVYYDGGKFPFRDHEFDYVICSHVLEHVQDIELFLAELTRVAPRGYLEFPTVFYEYLFNFPEHRNLLHYRDDVVLWMPKSETRLFDFELIQSFLCSTLEAGYDEVIQSLKECFFEGFEWQSSIVVTHVFNLTELIPSKIVIPPQAKVRTPPSSRELLSELFRRCGRRMRQLGARLHIG